MTRRWQRCTHRFNCFNSIVTIVSSVLCWTGRELAIPQRGDDKKMPEMHSPLQLLQFHCYNCQLSIVLVGLEGSWLYRSVVMTRRCQRCTHRFNCFNSIVTIVSSVLCWTGREPAMPQRGDDKKMPEMHSPLQLLQFHCYNCQQCIVLVGLEGSWLYRSVVMTRRCQRCTHRFNCFNSIVTIVSSVLCWLDWKGAGYTAATGRELAIPQRGDDKKMPEMHSPLQLLQFHCYNCQQCIVLVGLEGSWLYRSVVMTRRCQRCTHRFNCFNSIVTIVSSVLCWLDWKGAGYTAAW
ncbi:hypothetical protein J6590_041510 [Homalodisca vitripennis]|nr:hypothetical protein J6590_041510 [Homalodisca vitripennis]